MLDGILSPCVLHKQTYKTNVFVHFHVISAIMPSHETSGSTKCRLQKTILGSVDAYCADSVNLLVELLNLGRRYKEIARNPSAFARLMEMKLPDVGCRRGVSSDEGMEVPPASPASQMYKERHQSQAPKKPPPRFVAPK